MRGGEADELLWGKLIYQLNILSLLTLNNISNQNSLIKLCPTAILPFTYILESFPPNINILHVFPDSSSKFYGFSQIHSGDVTTLEPAQLKAEFSKKQLHEV